ncbi:Six-hairpin glycosidase [Auriculariales sp. MPI-PUGE-AT-0066]|nr:Six-hairpin glycosidase [Auriculariales sp. MPI-PUGE-AT-0066]
MRAFPAATLLLAVAQASASAALNAEQETFDSHISKIERMRGVAEASIRTSWEQGTASQAVLEWDYKDYTIFGRSPFKTTGQLPVKALQYALSAVTRQSADGRLSQQINDALDGAALDGASSAPAVILGIITQPERKDYWSTALQKQLDYVLNTVPKTATGAISMRSDTAQYWADGVYMGFPFIAYTGVVQDNQTLVQIAFDNCKAYHDVLVVTGPFGPRNGWAAKGIIQVAATIERSQFKNQMQEQLITLKGYIQEIFDGVFPSLRSDGLLPNYVNKPDSTFGDSAGSSCLASVVYRAAKTWPEQFDKKKYLDVANAIRKTILNDLDDLGLMKSIVDPLKWDQKGVVSTEGQSFGLMMMAAWRDYFNLKC